MITTSAHGLFLATGLSSVPSCFGSESLVRSVVSNIVHRTLGNRLADDARQCMNEQYGVDNYIRTEIRTAVAVAEAERPVSERSGGGQVD